MFDSTAKRFLCYSGKLLNYIYLNRRPCGAGFSLQRASARISEPLTHSRKFLHAPTGPSDAPALAKAWKGSFRLDPSRQVHAAQKSLVSPSGRELSNQWIAHEPCQHQVPLFHGPVQIPESSVHVAGTGIRKRKRERGNVLLRRQLFE